MTRRGFLVLACGLLLACGLVLNAAAPHAQAGAAKSDPITGTWTGELSPKDGPPPASVTFELKFDGKSQVTGSFTGLQEPGEVKNGTFDSESGALKLDLGKLDGAAVLIVLEGKVVNDEASGTIKAGPNTGSFKLAKKKT
jgi:hypothetical protein